MMATGLAVHQLEMDDPLTQAEESLIESVFKAQYAPQIKCWALVQSRSHKRKFFAFIAGTQAQKPVRAVSSTKAPQTQADFLFHTVNCQINLGLAFNPRPVTKQNNNQRFASPGVSGQGIFREGFVEPKPRANPKENETLATFIVGRLMNADVIPCFRPIANANYKLLQELTHWLDRKNTNQFPVDALLKHPTLSPYQECTANSARDREDHLSRPNIPPLPHKVRSAPIPPSVSWRTPCTQYSAFFNDDERFARGYLSGPYLPVEQSQPFGQFPHDRGDTPTPMIPDTRDPAFMRQAADDTKTGRRYKDIFESKTVL
jgi:hypothetical protein